jgi:CDP-diacylglycerol---glycerol-3-phosphate 3-phosphatidyltransferase
MPAPRTAPILRSMMGLYGYKSTFAYRLRWYRKKLIQHRVDPNKITAVGLVFAGIAAVALATMRPGVDEATLVGALLGYRLACANLDGDVARATGRTSRVGSIVNEAGDRLGEIAVFAGLAFVAPITAVAVAAFAAMLPSWVSLAGAAAGADRVQGGPMGKVERSLLVFLMPTTGFFAPLLYTIAAGSALTALLRLRRVHRLLRTADQHAEILHSVGNVPC